MTDAIPDAQIGREKPSGMSCMEQTRMEGKPAATMAASLIQGPPSRPGNACEPRFSFHFELSRCKCSPNERYPCQFSAQERHRIVP
jgi:hypothetical protein